MQTMSGFFRDPTCPMSGHADYNFTLEHNIISVPLKRATPDNFQQYGHFVQHYDKEAVTIVPWPVSGWRKLCPGTGIEGGITEGDFKYWWKDGFCYAKNEAVANGDYITAKKVGSCIYTREANYHPDGGQVFFPKTSKPFIMLLALPTDDIKAEQFVAFFFDGSCGCQIKPNIWHQPAYPLEDMVFRGKQGKVHACVAFDSLNEHNELFKINLDDVNSIQGLLGQ